MKIDENYIPEEELYNLKALLASDSTRELGIQTLKSNLKAITDSAGFLAQGGYLYTSDKCMKYVRDDDESWQYCNHCLVGLLWLCSSEKEPKVNLKGLGSIIQYMLDNTTEFSEWTEAFDDTYTTHMYGYTYTYELLRLKTGFVLKCKFIYSGESTEIYEGDD